MPWYKSTKYFFKDCIITIIIILLVVPHYVPPEVFQPIITGQTSHTKNYRVDGCRKDGKITHQQSRRCNCSLNLCNLIHLSNDYVLLTCNLACYTVQVRLVALIPIERKLQEFIALNVVDFQGNPRQRRRLQQTDRAC